MKNGNDAKSLEFAIPLFIPDIATMFESLICLMTARPMYRIVSRQDTDK